MVERVKTNILDYRLSVPSQLKCEGATECSVITAAQYSQRQGTSLLLLTQVVK